MPHTPCGSSSCTSCAGTSSCTHCRVPNLTVDNTLCVNHAALIDVCNVDGGALTVSNSATQTSGDLVKIAGVAGQSALRVQSGDTNLANTYNAGTLDVTGVTTMASRCSMTSSSTSYPTLLLDNTGNGNAMSITLSSTLAAGETALEVNVGNHQADPVSSPGISINLEGANNIPTPALLGYSGITTNFGSVVMSTCSISGVGMQCESDALGNIICTASTLRFIDQPKYESNTPALKPFEAGSGSKVGTLTLSDGAIDTSGNNALAISSGTATTTMTAGTVAMSANATVGGTLGVTGVGTFTAQSVHTGGIQSGGNIVSDADGTDDLGTTAVRWANVYTDSIGDAGQALDVAATTLSFDGASAIDTSGNHALAISSGTATTTMTAGTVAVNGALDVAGAITINSAALAIPHLADALVENDSMWLGSDPSSTTSTAQYNVAVGATALSAITGGDSNTAVGYYALTTCTEGDANTAFGSRALQQNDVGVQNVAVGNEALQSNTGGNYNTGVGTMALKANATGSKNVGVGFHALFSNASGVDNTAVGSDAMSMGASGSNNSAIGVRALTSNVTTSQNTGVGGESLRYVVSGGDNVGLGFRAGDVITTGSNNILIGSESDPSGAMASNQIVIGCTAVGHGDNIAVIGNTDCTAWHPEYDNGVDLGSDEFSFKDAWIQGAVTVGGTLDVTGVGTFATGATATAGNITATDGDIVISAADHGLTQAVHAVSSNVDASNGDITSNHYALSHTLTLDGTLADDAEHADITVTSSKVQATSVILANCSLNVHVTIHTVESGSFKVRITNKSGGILADDSTLILNYRILG